jgi:hypothetical protein
VKLVSYQTHEGTKCRQVGMPHFRSWPVSLETEFRFRTPVGFVYNFGDRQTSVHVVFHWLIMQSKWFRFSLPIRNLLDTPSYNPKLLTHFSDFYAQNIFLIPVFSIY